MKNTFSIQYKILLLVTGLVLFAIGVHLIIALETFKRDKTALTFDLNKNAVSALATELDTGLGAMLDKLKLYAILANEKPQTAVSAFDEILKNDPLLVYVDLKKVQGAGFKNICSNVQESYIESFGLDKTFFTDALPKSRNIPDADGKGPVFWNATVAGGPALLGIRLAVERGSQSSRSAETLIVTGFLKGEVFLKTMMSAAVTQTFIVDDAGHIVIHPEAAVIAAQMDVSHNPIVGEFLKNKNSNGVMKYEYEGRKMLGAYRRLAQGSMGVISEVENAKVFDAVTRLSIRTGLFALTVVTATFIISVLFSQSLIKPLTGLMNAMKRVAGGELNTQYEARTRDEIGVLSQVFNHMTNDLKISRRELEETNRTLEDKVKERTKQLEELAVRDTLTGLYNRRFFNEKLAGELNISKRFKSPTSIIYLDIDHFKKYNDANGHPMGDSLLKTFAKVLTESVRAVDVVCRLGGEEFCIILPKTDIAGAKIAAEKVRRAVETTKFENGERQPLGKVTCSSGVGEFPLTGHDEESLVQSADKALYHIKEGGRNAVGVAVPLKNAA